MESKAAVAALAALAHVGRLAAFRLLVQIGPEGMAAGEIARRIGVLPNTLSANLNLLGNAGLIGSRREGRSIIYVADYAGMTALLGFLVEDCCGGSTAICTPIYEALARTACEPPQGSA